MADKEKAPEAESTPAGPPGPGEPGYDKMAVPKFILTLIHQGKKEKKIVDMVKDKYPYSRVNVRHVAWMASAQAFGDLDPEKYSD